MIRFSRVLFAALVVVAGLVRPAAAQVVQPSPDLRGICVTSFPVTAQTSMAAFETALAVSGVDGMVLDFGWDTLEPAPKTYQWDLVESWLKLAKRHNKKLTLAIRADKTPDWLFKTGLTGTPATKLTFGWKGVCGAVKIAAPWDPRFLEAWGAMIGDVAAHLRAEHLDDVVTIVRITGVNVDSNETHLPSSDATTGCTPTDDEMWKNAPATPGNAPGFSEANLLVGWNAILGFFDSAFRGKVFSVAIIDSIHPFPIVPGGPDTSRTQNAPLILALRTKFPGRLVIQNNSLYPKENAQKETVDFATEKTTPPTPPTWIAFQTNKVERAQAGCNGRHQAPAPCTDALYLNMLNTGIYPAGYPGRAQYIEVFPDDAKGFPAAILKAHEELFATPLPPPRGGGGCPPQPPGQPNPCQ